MLFAILIILMLGAVVFFHYLQGFFSATLSAIFAVIAAVVAVSYHEWIVEQFLGDTLGDWGPAMVMLVLFALSYLIFRLIFDKAIPGQIRLPATMDKIGGATMGLVAGVFALGIVVIAAQQMPLGPSIAGYVRYETNSSRGVVVPTGANTRAKDANAYDEVIADRFTEEDAEQLLVPVDDIVISTVAHLSDGGSLATGKPLESIHPDYLQELFGQRLGMETGSTRTARNLAGKQAVDVLAVYEAPVFEDAQVLDHEFPSMRLGQQPLKPPPLGEDEIRVAVRVSFTVEAADKKDNRIRLAPSSVRLVAQRPDELGELEYHNYFPIGTIDPNGNLYLNKIDDPLYINSSAVKVDGSPASPQVDFVFQVKKRGFLATGEKGKPLPIEPGTFLEVKKMARVELSGEQKGVVKPSMDPPNVIALWRKHLEWSNKALPPPMNPGGGKAAGGGMPGGMGGYGAPAGASGPPGAAGPPGTAGPPQGQSPAQSPAGGAMTPDQAGENGRHVVEHHRWGHAHLHVQRGQHLRRLAQQQRQVRNGNLESHRGQRPGNRRGGAHQLVRKR